MKNRWGRIFCIISMVIAGCMAAGNMSLAEQSGAYSYEILPDGTAKLTKYSGSNPENIPTSIDGRTVTVIGDRLYFSKPLKDNTIPATVREIGECAFGYAEAKNIVIPSTVKKCERDIFFNSKVESVIFEEGCTEIPKGIFSGCDNLKSVKLPESIRYIREEAFSFCGTIPELVLPEGILEIEYNAFYATHITKLVAKCKNAKLEDEAFNGCSVKQLQCYYNSAIYKEFKDCDGTKISFIDNPLFFQKKKVTLAVGAETTLKITGKGTIKWKSSNKKIATVSKKGVVTAKKTGTVTITATCNGKKATCKVKVKKNERKLENYSTKASSYAYNQTLLGFKKIKRDSKGNYVISGHLINTFGSSTSYAKNLVIKVYKNDKLIAKQTFKRWNIRVGACSSKPITLTIKKKNIRKKKTDLTTGSIRVVIAGGRIF